MIENPGPTRRAFLGYATTAGLGLVAACQGSTKSKSNSAAAIPNVRVSERNAAGYVECSIAVNPREPRNLLAASMVFGTGAAAGIPLIGTFSSFDAGRTWAENGALPLPPGTNHSNDPTAAFDVRGRGFVAAMATVQTAQGISSTDRGVYVWRSVDGGRNFSVPVAVLRGQFADHPWIAAGVAADERLYVTWRTRDPGGLLFSRSSDGGLTFDPPRRIIPASTQTAIDRVAAGPAGAVHSAYVALAGRGYQLEIVSSKDGGDTFAAPTVVGPIPLALDQPGGTRIENGPGLAVSPVDGTVYVAYPANRPGSSEPEIRLARSHDGGARWGPAAAVSGRPGGAASLQPEVVADETGQVAVTYLVLTRDRVEVRLARSADRGDTFQSPQTVTSRPFDPRLSAVAEGGKHGAWFLGDYQGLAAGGGAVHPIWADTRTGRADLFTASVALR